MDEDYEDYEEDNPWGEDEDFGSDEEQQEEWCEFRDERGAEERTGLDDMQLTIKRKLEDIQDAAIELETISPSDAIIGPLPENFRERFETSNGMEINILASMIVSAPRVHDAILNLRRGDKREFNTVVGILQGTLNIDGSPNPQPKPPVVVTEHLTGPKGLDNIPFILIRYDTKIHNN